ncbi:MAG: hypothetical protein EBZ46_08250 [Actinobacteria bacterium]|nr:hypothetical protein [Actinomycetota bacterium]
MDKVFTKLLRFESGTVVPVVENSVQRFMFRKISILSDAKLPQVTMTATRFTVLSPYGNVAGSGIL